jgi:hypothetical protein
MPWYIALYVTALMGLGAASTIEAVSERRSPAFIAFDALVSLALPTFVVLLWHPGSAPPRVVLVPAVLLAVGASAQETWRELRAARAVRHESDDPELSPAANLRIDRIGEATIAIIAWAVILPAVIAGVRLIQIS